jgi:hypothetical protein
MIDDDDVDRGEGLTVWSPEQAKVLMAISRAIENADTFKADAEYQDEPFGPEQCDKCTMFVPPNYCSARLLTDKPTFDFH